MGNRQWYRESQRQVWETTLHKSMQTHLDMVKMHNFL